MVRALESTKTRPLPAGRGAAPGAVRGFDQRPERPAGGDRGAVKSEGSIRVLVVDDHALVRTGIRCILQDCSQVREADEAADGRAALAMLGRKPYSVVLLDIAMPGRDGLDTLKEIRARSPRTAVLMLTMYPEEQYAVRALRAGAVGYVTKDRLAEDLIRAVQAAAAGHRYVSPRALDRLVDALEHGDETSPAELLSDREHQVLRQIGSGKTVSEIAAEMSLSVKTVSTYRTRLLRKTGLKTNADLIRYAIRHGLAE